MVPRRSRSAFMLMVKVVSGIQQKDALFALGCGWMFSGRFETWHGRVANRFEGVRL